MSLLRWTLMGCLAVALVGCDKAAKDGKSSKEKESTKTEAKNEPKTESAKPKPKKEASNKDKIVGVWEVIKGGDLPPGSTFEFTKDNKMKVSVKMGDKTMELQGTYKVEGDKMTNTGKGPDGKEQTETDAILKLTETELVLKDPHDKTMELKKKK